jgi:hypothetical protein
MFATVLGSVLFIGSIGNVHLFGGHFCPYKLY